MKIKKLILCLCIIASSPVALSHKHKKHSCLEENFTFFSRFYNGQKASEFTMTYCDNRSKVGYENVNCLSDTFTFINKSETNKNLILKKSLKRCSTDVDLFSKETAEKE